MSALLEFLLGVVFGTAVVSLVVVPVLYALKWWLGEWDDRDDDFSRWRDHRFRHRAGWRSDRARFDE